MTEQHSMLVDVARREIGVREATGHNDGTRVEEYQRITGGTRGQPWCADFVSWCMAQTDKAEGRSAPLCTAGAVDLYHKAHKKGLRTVEPGGDLGLVGPGWVWVRAKDAAGAAAARHGTSVLGHCGIVTSAIGHDGSFETVEGNTNKAGSRDGDGVYAKSQNCKTDARFVAFVDPYSGKV